MRGPRVLIRIERFEKDGFEPSFSWFKIMNSGHNFGDGGEREANAKLRGLGCPEPGLAASRQEVCMGSTQAVQNGTQSI